MNTRMGIKVTAFCLLVLSLEAELAKSQDDTKRDIAMRLAKNADALDELLSGIERIEIFTFDPDSGWESEEQRKLEMLHA